MNNFVKSLQVKNKTSAVTLEPRSEELWNNIGFQFTSLVDILLITGSVDRRIQRL